jgi:hypothetical protein
MQQTYARLVRRAAAVTLPNGSKRDITRVEVRGVLPAPGGWSWIEIAGGTTLLVQESPDTVRERLAA